MGRSIAARTRIVKFKAEDRKRNAWKGIPSNPPPSALIINVKTLTRKLYEIHAKNTNTVRELKGKIQDTRLGVAGSTTVALVPRLAVAAS